MVFGVLAAAHGAVTTDHGHTRGSAAAEDGNLDGWHRVCPFPPSVLLHDSRKERERERLKSVDLHRETADVVVAGFFVDDKYFTPTGGGGGSLNFYQHFFSILWIRINS